MHAHERVDAGDLEHTGHTGFRRRDEVELASRVADASRRLREDADARRVQEGAPGQIDDDVLRPFVPTQSLLEDGHGGEIQLAHDVNDRLPAGRLLDAYVKIAWRGHDGRV